MRKVHKLKTWPEYFNAILDGSKTFEYRINDREFKVDDILVLQEWEPHSAQYTGRNIEIVVTYVLDLMKTEDRNMVVMSIGKCLKIMQK